MCASSAALSASGPRCAGKAPRSRADRSASGASVQITGLSSATAAPGDACSGGGGSGTECSVDFELELELAFDFNFELDFALLDALIVVSRREFGTARLFVFFLVLFEQRHRTQLETSLISVSRNAHIYREI